MLSRRVGCTGGSGARTHLLRASRELGPADSLLQHSSFGGVARQL